MQKIVSLLAGLWLCLCVSAQEKPLSVEKIYDEGMLYARGIPMFKWMSDGEHYSRAEFNDDEGAQEIVRYRADNGSRTVLVAAKQLHGLSLNSYEWSADGQRMLLFHNAKKVWRYATRGDYTVLDLATGRRHRLGQGLPAASLMFAKFSPDGGRVAYVSHNNIYVEDIDNQTITKITEDGDEHIINGTFDWMYEEEFDCRDGFRWSGDGQSIAYWQSDTRGTGIFYLINNTDSLYSRPVPLPYPKVGTTIAAVRTGVVSAQGGATRWIDIPGDPREHYLPRMDYVPGSNDLLIQQLNRAQNINTLWIVHNGTPAALFSETDTAWVDVNDDIRWIDGGKRFLWMSERDGWRHLYSISRDGKQTVCLTPGNLDVVSIAGIDEAGGTLYFISTDKNYTQRYLYRAGLDPNRRPRVRPLNAASQKGQHSYDFSPTGRWAMHCFQNAATPPIYDMLHFPDARTERVMEDNADVRRAFDSLHLARKEFLKVDIGDILLDVWMIKPNNFDETKKYPVIVHVYGEPANSTVQDSWSGGDLWHRYLAQEGYVVMSIDNRGANVPRGRAWRKSIYRNIGLRNIDDQAAAMRKLLDTYPFLDAARVGVSGWSWGGSSTLSLMFRYPDLYSVGIAIAFISNQRLYDAAYQERYMGLPTGDDDAFARGSAIRYARGLRGKLLLIHGTGDDNVHYQNCELLINELVRQKKMFSLLSYPNRSHRISEGFNTTLHLRLSMDRFWKENLPQGAR